LFDTGDALVYANTSTTEGSEDEAFKRFRKINTPGVPLTDADWVLGNLFHAIATVHDDASAAERTRSAEVARQHTARELANLRGECERRFGNDGNSRLLRAMLQCRRAADPDNVRAAGR
jgi:hypothetical protein